MSTTQTTHARASTFGRLIASRGRLPTSVLAAWVATRLLLVLSAVIPAEVLGAGDIARYLAVADVLADGDSVRVWEYPIAALAVVMPPVLLGISEYNDYLVAFMALAVGLDFATFAAVLTASPSRGWNIRGAWVWVAGPALLGFITITRLDIAACCLAAAGMSLVIQGRSPRLAGAALALGAAIKVWPALFLAGCLSLTRSRSSLLTGAILTGAGTLVVTVILRWQYLLSDFLSYQKDRGLQAESITALPLLWADRLGLADYRLKFEFGSQQLYGPGTDALAAATTWAMYFGMFCITAYCTRHWRRLTESPDLALHAGTVALSLLIVTNKVFSPQYMLWLLIAYAALGASRLFSSKCAVLILLATAVTHVLFPYQYSELIAGDLMPLIALTIRDGLVIAVTFMLLTHLRVLKDRPESTGFPQSISVRT